jgi:hypothetical protein
LNPAERADLADRVARARLARQAEDEAARRNQPVVKPRDPDQHNLKIIAKLEHEIRGLRHELEVANRMLEEARRPPTIPTRNKQPAEDPYKKRYEIALKRNEILARKLRERNA